MLSDASHTYNSLRELTSVLDMILYLRIWNQFETYMFDFQEEKMNKED